MMQQRTGVEITRPLLRGFGYAEPVRTVEPCEQHVLRKGERP